MSALSIAAFSRLHRLFLLAMGLMCIVVIALAIKQTLSGWSIETNLQALLPPASNNAVIAVAERQFAAAAAKRIVLLLSSTNRDEVKQAAALSRQLIKQQPLLNLPNAAKRTAAYKNWVAHLHPHQFHLLARQQRKLLEQGKTDTILQQAQRSLYDLASWSRAIPLQHDPLNLFNQYVASLKLGPENIDVEGQDLFLSSTDLPNRHMILLLVEVDASPFSLHTQTVITQTVDHLEDQLKQRFPTLQLLRSGIVFHAANATEKAMGDVRFITVGSIVGIILLFWAAFRSAKPLLISISSIAFGCLTALAVSSALFERIHLLTLVFGASLIGVSVDYSLHYFSHIYTTDSSAKLATQQQTSSPMRCIIKALALGLLTSLIGYGCLLQSPLPGLRQIAVFSVAGLIGAWLFVASLYPFISSKSAYLETGLRLLARRPQYLWLQLGQKKTLFTLATLLLLATVIIAFGMQTTYDPRTFYSPSENLLKQEQQLHQLLKSPAPSQFFVVTAKDGQTTLQTEAKFLQVLQQLKSRGVIDSYTATSQYLPSIKNQVENYRLQQRYLYGNSSGAAYHFMRSLGVDDEAISALQKRFANSRNNYMTIGKWLVTASSEQRLLWLGKLEQTATEKETYASLIVLQGINDLDALTKIMDGLSNSTDNVDYGDIIFVDKVKSLSKVLRLQQNSATSVLMLAYGAVAVLLIFYYRSFRALSLIFTPVLSTLLILAVFSVTGTAVNLFHVFALFLVLGLGMDYSIFLHESGSQDSACLLAILLSALTSCLSFGLLSFSSTPMVQAFGTTILIASLLNLILAPAVNLGSGQSITAAANNLQRV